MATNEQKEQTSSQRGDQEVSRVCNNSDSSRGLEATGGSTGNFDVGISRTDWEAKNLDICVLLGGIIKQLRANEEQRLKEVRECIEWYEREENIVQSRIAELEQLQKQAEQSTSSLADTSTKLVSIEEE